MNFITYKIYNPDTNYFECFEISDLHQILILSADKEPLASINQINIKRGWHILSAHQHCGYKILMDENYIMSGNSRQRIFF